MASQIEQVAAAALVSGAETTLHSHAGGGAVDIKQVELDFGTALRQKTKSFIVTDTGVSLTSQILMLQAMDAPTNKSQDENEMDTFNCRCVPGVGQFSAYVESLWGSVTGKFRFNYLAG